MNDEEKVINEMFLKKLAKGDIQYVDHYKTFLDCIRIRQSIEANTVTRTNK